MGKVILYITTSLDGYIAKEDGDISWLNKYNINSYGYDEFLNNTDTIVMGSKTFENISSFKEWPYKNIKTYVMTSRIIQADSHVEFVPGNLQNLIPTLKESSENNIYLVGGSDLVKSFIEEKLLEEIKLFIVPEVLGKGIPLFYKYQTQVIFKPIHIESYVNNMVQIHYVLNYQ
ncbi:MAG: dihydrofolate reductase family protein [Candidatus Roizmanbacteria bacterium]